MDRAPLPPHERPWRHPSELGPPSHEPTSTSGRVLIVTTATLSLLLIGLLAVSMTPDRGTPPVAVQATNEEPSARPAALEQPTLPMVTPLGDEGWAVTTSGAVGARAGKMAARLPSGDVVDVEIVRRDAESGVTLVSLPEQTDGYQLAERSPGPTDTVVVHSAEPRVVTMLAVADLEEVAEGTPVLDRAGALVGICTTGTHGVAVMTVSTMPGTVATTSTTAAKPATTAVTTAPTATTVVTPTTVAPTTTAAAPTVPTTAATTVPVTASSVAAPVTTAPVSGGGASTTAPG